ncbi:DNA helicase IV [Crossiella equi]|uniref:DNA helicase IV n=1 Tax=Crossiella equi TaxID=130796 RepID=A0ABS5AVF1_9PSEU|nr:UvrD-helicase domain-containing protein [Crossiella equi]MBP2479710.1 DNA helicase IV [Crossiella equi]
MSSTEHREVLAAERAHLNRLYLTLDRERARAEEQLDRERAAGDSLGRWQRDTAVATWRRRITQLREAERGLCFGRLDLLDGTGTHIGRIGLFEEDEGEALLVDWRAPAARPFYCATAANPGDVLRRRHFHTRGRQLVDYHDDVLSGVGVPDADSALMAALRAPRGEAMRDIVTTIQAEQDEVIRLEHQGVLVIEGGPGTGKTAVALHRVAYLLYRHRERLSRRGVLIVGPNAGFLRHISAVLPSLGETDVVFCAPGELYPGVVATAEDGPEQSRVKGDLAAVDVVARAVADRQELPGEPIALELDDVTLEIDDALAGQARRLARATGLTHNPARRVFREHLGALLVRQAVARLGEGWLDPEDPPHVSAELAEDVRAELRGLPEFHDAVERLWPVLTPQRLLADLYESPERLRAAGAPGLLHRADGQAWTVADVPLLDEAAELLGEDTVDEQRRARRQAEAEAEYAEGVLQILDAHDEEETRIADVVDAAVLARRQDELDHRSLAERAVADRTWTYGHLVVDEAQELSPMCWRVLMRRNPSHSATLVGDRAQRSSPGAGRDWASSLSPYVGDRWQYRRLTVNYRTPAEIMAVADPVLALISSESAPSTSVRHGDRPWLRVVPSEAVPGAVREAVVRERRAAAAGRSVAVIATATVLATLDLPDGVTALTPAQAKGLEFDVVVVADPGAVLTGGEAGPADLYVALTRATQRLGLVCATELPACLRGTEGRWARPAELVH